MPILHNDRIKLPIRKPFELIGWYVDWYQNIETDPVTKERHIGIMFLSNTVDEHTLEKFGINDRGIKMFLSLPLRLVEHCDGT